MAEPFQVQFYEAAPAFVVSFPRYVQISTGGSGAASGGSMDWAIPLNCSDGTSHHVTVVVRDGQHTIHVSQEALGDLGYPLALTLASIDDKSCHDVTITLVDGGYTYHVDQVVSPTTTFRVAALLACLDDSSDRSIRIRNLGGFYTLRPS